MDRLTFISGLLFVTADIFAITSLSKPDWIVTNVGGETRMGLMWSCVTLHNRPKVCNAPELQPEWLLALICIFLGCICITTTIILLASSHWDRNVIPYARWVGFTAMVLFCLAAVIFPIGFHIDEIGGQPYQLPSSHQVGISYIMFVLSLWITVISELFAVVLFSLAAVIFPIGFYIDEIGGQPYQLPNSYRIGQSYVMFLSSLWLTVFSELFAGKVCIPQV